MDKLIFKKTSFSKFSTRLNIFIADEWFVWEVENSLRRLSIFAKGIHQTPGDDLNAYSTDEVVNNPKTFFKGINFHNREGFVTKIKLECKSWFVRDLNNVLWLLIEYSKYLDTNEVTMLRKLCLPITLKEIYMSNDICTIINAILIKINQLESLSMAES